MVKKKFSKRKLRWFMRNKGIVDNRELAFLMGIHEKYVHELYRRIKARGVDNYYQSRGRRKKIRPPEWSELINHTYKKQRCGAKIMEKILDKHYNTHIPHNYIHEVLRGNNMAKEDKKKQKQRRYKRYERKHSNSAWHVDYKWIEHEQKWLIAYIDDHSRFIVGYAMFNEATTENALKILYIAISLYGKPREIISDKGSQFYANRKDKWGNRALSIFEKKLSELGIKLITGRRNHPQTNGKIERWFRTWVDHHWRYKTLGDFVFWYNVVRYHSAIEYDTPITVFFRDMKKLIEFKE